MAYLYHVTTEENAKSILKNGLIPKIGERSQLVGETEKYVYLCGRKDVPFWSLILDKPVVLRVEVKIPHTQGYVACNTHRSGYLKPTQPSRLGLPLALWFVRIQARRHLCSHNSTWKTFRVAAASGHLTGTAYGQAVKP